jgi:hypothetical protein
MRKTIIAYILSCIEEIEDNQELGMEVRLLHDKLFEEIERKPDDLLNVLFLYTIVFEYDYQLGLEIRNLYKEIKYFFDEYQTNP